MNSLSALSKALMPHWFYTLQRLQHGGISWDILGSGVRQEDLYNTCVLTWQPLAYLTKSAAAFLNVSLSGQLFYCSFSFLFSVSREENYNFICYPEDNIQHTVYTLQSYYFFLSVFCPGDSHRYWIHKCSSSVSKINTTGFNHFLNCLCRPSLFLMHSRPTK